MSRNKLHTRSKIKGKDYDMAEESMCEVICPKCGEPLSPGVDHYVYNDPLSRRIDFDRKVCIQRCPNGHTTETVLFDMTGIKNANPRNERELA